jgi:hypothetical protein
MTRAEILLHPVNRTATTAAARGGSQVPGFRAPTTDLPVFLRDVPQA